MSTALLSFGNCSNVEISQIMFDGNRAGQTHTSKYNQDCTNHGICLMSDCTNFNIHDNVFIRQGTLISGGDLQGDGVYARNGVREITIERNRFEDWGRMAVTLERPYPLPGTPTKGFYIRQNAMFAGNYEDGSVTLAAIDIEPWNAFENIVIESNKFYGSMARISVGSRPAPIRQICRNIKINNNVWDLRGWASPKLSPKKMIMVGTGGWFIATPDCRGDAGQTTIDCPQSFVTRGVVVGMPVSGTGLGKGAIVSQIHADGSGSPARISVSVPHSGPISGVISFSAVGGGPYYFRTIENLQIDSNSIFASKGLPNFCSLSFLELKRFSFSHNKLISTATTLDAEPFLSVNRPGISGLWELNDNSVPIKSKVFDLSTWYNPQLNTDYVLRISGNHVGKTSSAYSLSADDRMIAGSGTLTIVAGNPMISGSNSNFLGELKVGQTIQITSTRESLLIKQLISKNSALLSTPPAKSTSQSSFKRSAGSVEFTHNHTGEQSTGAGSLIHSNGVAFHMSDNQWGPGRNSISPNIIMNRP